MSKLLSFFTDRNHMILYVLMVCGSPLVFLLFTILSFSILFIDPAIAVTYSNTNHIYGLTPFTLLLIFIHLLLFFFTWHYHAKSRLREVILYLLSISLLATMTTRYVVLAQSLCFARANSQKDANEM